ncbi:hypothetical protein RRSWK_00325 [Rhodopirellula sp. SWK7]|nr:hypothetical protein RRSWK_00325 [Rhodopirellula sp. SWK7]
MQISPPFIQTNEWHEQPAAPISKCIRFETTDFLPGIPVANLRTYCAQ